MTEIQIKNIVDYFIKYKILQIYPTPHGDALDAKYIDVVVRFLVGIISDFMETYARENCSETHGKKCPLVKSIHYRADGTIERVYFVAPIDSHPIIFTPGEISNRPGGGQ